MNHHLIQAKFDAASGGLLVTLPLWLPTLQSVNFWAGEIVLLCGVVLGLAGVWRLLSRRDERGRYDD